LAVCHWRLPLPLTQIVLSFPTAAFMKQALRIHGFCFNGPLTGWLNDPICLFLPFVDPLEQFVDSGSVLLAAIQLKK
jgi:hypothetical protein